MSSLNDLPLQDGDGDHVPVAPSAPSSPGPRAVVIVVLVAGALAAGTWFYLSRPRPGDARATTSTSPPPVSADAVPAAAPPLPPLAEMDPFVRTLLAALGSHPELLKWLATDDLVGSIATAIDRLAQGQSPARDLAVLRPAQGFAVARRNGDRIDPAGYARYTPLAQAVASVDPQALARAFATLRPRIVEAYVQQGHPQSGFDEAVRLAIAVVTSTPEAPADAALVPGVGGYAYADPSLERLPPAQRHLLRMGPDNARLVTDAARRFGAALAATNASR